MTGAAAIDGDIADLVTALFFKAASGCTYTIYVRALTQCEVKLST
jgi:hypothetical protein